MMRPGSVSLPSTPPGLRGDLLDSEAEDELQESPALALEGSAAQGLAEAADQSAEEMGFTPAQALWLEMRLGRVAGVMQESQGHSHHLEETLAAANSNFEANIEARDATITTLIKRISEIEKLLLHLGEQISGVALNLAGVENERMQNRQRVRFELNNLGFELNNLGVMMREEIFSDLETLKISIGECKTSLSDGEGGTPKQSREKAGLVPIKHLMPETWDGNVKQWRIWRDAVERYVDAADEHLRKQMDPVKTVKVAITEESFKMLGGTDFSKGKQLMTLLMAKTSSDAQTLVIGSPEDNGWEAWRRLHSFFELTLAVRESEVSADFSLMCRKPAKDTNELRKMMIEMQDKIRKFKEVVGKPPDEMHEKSILTAILDPETRKHTVSQQNMSVPLIDLKQKIEEFVNAVGAGQRTCRHEVSALVEDQSWSQVGAQAWEEYEYPPGLHADRASEETEEDGGELRALKGKGKGGKGCFECGNPNHYARNCPSKAFGKTGFKGSWKGGAGKSSWSKGGKSKGKGKAAPPHITCYTCGGNHWQSDCPKGKSKGKGNLYSLNEEYSWNQEWPQAEIKQLSSLQTSTREEEGKSRRWGRMQHVQNGPSRKHIAVAAKPTETCKILGDGGADSEGLFCTTKTLKAAPHHVRTCRY
ncbi:hypothetical protein N9L68_00955 [bacterium]|nr:hypothetical protein [bacterium]